MSRLVPAFSLATLLSATLVPFAFAQAPAFDPLSAAPMGGGSLESALPASAPPVPGAAPSATPAPVKAKPKPKPIPIRETALPTNPEPTFTQEVFFSTAKAAEHYAAIADAGGWPTVPGGLAPGAKGKGVAALRKRLAIEGDLDAMRADRP